MFYHKKMILSVVVTRITSKFRIDLWTQKRFKFILILY